MMDNRFGWLMSDRWHDSDIVMMNTEVPLEAYLPPQDQWSHVHLLVTNDDNGLNNGAFFIHVHPWSIKLLRDAFSIKTYEPNVDLEYSEQTALELWLLSVCHVETIGYAQNTHMSRTLTERASSTYPNAGSTHSQESGI